MLCPKCDEALSVYNKSIEDTLYSGFTDAHCYECDSDYLLWVTYEIKEDNNG